MAKNPTNDFIIPPEGVKFRLKAHESGLVIYSRPDEEPLVGQVSAKPVNEDQVFVLIYGEDEHDGMFAIKSWYCGKVLYSRRTEQPYVSNVYGNGAYQDNWFQFVPDPNDKASFRIYNHASNSVLFSDSKDFGNTTGGQHANQLWRFELV